VSAGFTLIEHGVAVLVVLGVGGEIHLLNHHCLTFGWLVMLTGATITMTASSNFVIKRTIDPFVVGAGRRREGWWAKQQESKKKKKRKSY